MRRLPFEMPETSTERLLYAIEGAVPPLVAEILMQLEPRLGADVLVRKAQMEKVLPDVLEVVERFLGGEASISLSERVRSVSWESSA